MSNLGDMQSIGLFGWWQTATSTVGVPPSPAPSGVVAFAVVGSFGITLTGFSTQANTTVQLETRPLGTNADWAVQASTTTPEIGMVLTVTGLEAGVALEWRLSQVDASENVADGTHGIFSPKASTATAGSSCGGDFFSKTPATVYKPCRTKHDPWSGS